MLFRDYFFHLIRISIAHCAVNVYHVSTILLFNNVTFCTELHILFRGFGDFSLFADIYELRNDSTRVSPYDVSGYLVYASRKFEVLLQGETSVFVMQPKFNAESNFWYEDILPPYVFLQVPRVLASTRLSQVTDRRTSVESKKFEVNFHQLRTNVEVPCLRRQSVQRERCVRKCKVKSRILSV